MKTIMKISLAVILTFVTIQFAEAQDVIRKHSGITIEAKILEVGSVEIKYYKYNTTDNVVYGVDKIDVKEIRYEDGRIEEIKDPFNNEELYATQKKQALKINMLCAFAGHANVTYERSLRPGRSFEVELGLIYGRSLSKKVTSGMYGGLSYKISTKPNYKSRGMRYTHIMNGAYIRPEIVFGQYNEKWTTGTFLFFFGDVEKKEAKITYGAVLMNLGKQWIINDRFLIDLHAGLGYGGAKNVGDGEEDSFHYGVATFNGLATTGGLKIGILF